MTDTPSPILLLRIQSVGSNTHLWGGYLNTAMETLEQAAKGYQTEALTVSVTISWTNYALGNIGQCAWLKLTGSLSSAITMVLPNYDNFLGIDNESGATVTIMCSGGTGVAVPNQRKTLLYCNATDYFSAVPTWTGDSTTLTNNGDLVTNLQLTNAIAAITAGSVTGLALNSATATQANYLLSLLAISLTGAISGSWSKISGGTSAEQSQLNLTVGSLALTLQAEQTASFNATAGKLWPVNIASAGTVTFPASASEGDTIGIMNYGAGAVTFSWNSLKYNGSTGSLVTNNKGLALFVYTNATNGWTDA